jgi:ABC-type antimicrobial peptide transport system permease subunit
MHFDLDSCVQLSFTQKTHDKYPPVGFEILKPIGFLSSAPVFSMSEFPQKKMQDAVVSFPTFLKFTQHGLTKINQVDRIPIQYVYINFQYGVTQSQVDSVFHQLARLGIPMGVSDSNDKIANLKIAGDSLYAFSVLTTIIVMIMCFFSLTSSMYTNVLEQSKEIAILRALGSRRFTIMRIYIYESFILVISSSIMGLGIGAFVAYTYIGQRSLFIQMKIPFVFPWEITIAVFIMGIIFSFLSSIIPIYFLLFDTITNVMRRVQ